MKIINTATDSPSDTLGRLALYSGLDVLTLFEIKDGLSALMDENRWKTYEFEMDKGYEHTNKTVAFLFVYHIIYLPLTLR